MFIKVTPKKDGNKIYKTASLVEGYRDKEKGYVRHKVKRYFGSVDDEEIKKLKFVYNKGVDVDKLVSIDRIEIGQVKPYGDVYVLKYLWDWWGLGEKIEELIKDKRYKEGNLTSQICLLTINRCVEPLTENKIKDWYEERSAISHLIPQETYSNRFYRGLKTLDKIYSTLQVKITEQIKKNIYKGKKIEEVYYDLTSTYFESSKLCVLASFGYSRDKRSDKKQIVIGLVIDKYGFPLWVEIFPGNTSDKSTLKVQIDNLKEKAKIEDIILIGDRGLMSKGNITHIVEANYKYIIGMRNIECKKVVKFKISEKTMEKIEENKYIREITEEGEKYVVYLNTDRRKKEQETRERNLSGLEERLVELKEMIRKREIVSRDIVLIKLGETFKKFSSVKKYIKVEVDKELRGEGSFRYRINREKVIEDKVFDGITVIKTNVIPLDARDIISTYKNLERIERAFRCLKDVIKIGPINHHRDENVRGHIYICILSYLLMTTIEYRLSAGSLGRKSAGSPVGATPRGIHSQ